MVSDGPRGAPYGEAVASPFAVNSLSVLVENRRLCPPENLLFHEGELALVSGLEGHDRLPRQDRFA
jgi:hypothetical protein